MTKYIFLQIFLGILFPAIGLYLGYLVYKNPLKWGWLVRRDFEELKFKYRKDECKEQFNKLCKNNANYLIAPSILWMMFFWLLQMQKFLSS